MTNGQIITRRLIMRPLVLEDAAALQELANDYAVSSMVSSMPYPYTMDDALDFLIQIVPQALAQGDVIFALAWKAEGAKLIGCLGCEKQWDNGRPDVGYWLGRPYWGQGVMSEAAQALVDYLFTCWNVDDLTAGYFGENTASKRILEKIGFRDYGPKLFPCMARGTPVQGRKMALLRSEWVKARESEERAL